MYKIIRIIVIHKSENKLLPEFGIGIFHKDLGTEGVEDIGLGFIISVFDNFCICAGE